MENTKQGDQEGGFMTEPNMDGFFSDLTNQNACSVRVAVRVRPLHGQRELSGGNQRMCVETDSSDNKLQIGDKNFQFDHVFDQQSTQIEIFDICAKNLVLGCLAGFNATILVYGQTGSGKTHSMGTGSTVGMLEEQIGIVPRVFAFMFSELHKRQQQSSFSEFTIKVSFLELYNEELHDLLDPNGMLLDKVTQKPLKELQIREEKSGSIRIDNLKEEVVTSKEECLQLLNKGISHRVTSATLCNETSSRSHAIFTVTIEQKIVKEAETVMDAASGSNDPVEIAASEEHISAKFHFVDLAGSERIKKTGATGQLLKEGISINKGLLSLGNVISALTEETRKNQHIPYRDSKLTRILQDSLGGNSRTTMIACVSPAEINHEETLNSIKYASRARNIKNKPVVNRDANSILIESLKTQISQLTNEIVEYQKIVKDNNLSMPEAAANAVTTTSSSGPPLQSQQTLHSGGGGNPVEIKELKIKLSKKEKEYKELQEQLQAALLKQKARDSEFSSIQKERDTLRMKNEILVEHMQKNNLQIDSDEIGGGTSKAESLIDEYKAKIEQLQKEMEKKNQELQLKTKKVAEMQLQSQRDEDLLKKHLEENQKLKRQIKKNDEMGPSSINSSSTKNSASSGGGQPRLKNPQKDSNDGNNMKYNQIQGKIMENFNEQFISNLANQIGNILVVNNTASSNDDTNNLSQIAINQTMDNTGVDISTSNMDISGTASSLDDTINSSMAGITTNEQMSESVEEKERILEAVKQSTKHMQGELEKLMKLECDKKIQEIEKDLQKADNERKDNIKNASNDSGKVQQIEKEHKLKMEELNRKLLDFKEKEKKQEQVIKQLSSQEAKLKGLESDVVRVKKAKEEMEKQMKLDNDKFQKYKSSINKELVIAKKFAQDKEKMMAKLKQDLKKTDQIAQQKVAELKGLQKRAKEERAKREQQKLEEQETKGIDIDRIKEWIVVNTARMLSHRDMKEQLEKLIDEREQIEEDMLSEGDKLTELMLQKERKQAEKEMLEEQYQKLADEGADQELDEGPILEIEQEIDGFCVQINQITDALDSMDETLSFLTKNINEISEDFAGMDAENVEPLQFSGLQSIDAAKVTLQTFFGVLLDLNIYKRDLESKCIEQDESVLEQNEKISLLQLRVDELVTKLQETGQGASELMLSPGQSAENQSKVLQMHKDKAIKNIVESLEGYVEHDNIKHLNLTPNEQTSLTKLSLSKIVSNLKTKLREEETRNSNLSHKLEHAINEKDAIKQKFEQYKKEQKSTLMVPMSSGSRLGSRGGPTPQPSDQPNSAGIDKSSSVKESGVSQPKAIAKPTFRFKAKKEAAAANGGAEDGQIGATQIKISNLSRNNGATAVGNTPGTTAGGQSQLSQRRAEKQQQREQLNGTKPTGQPNPSPRKHDRQQQQVAGGQPGQKELLEITTYTRPKGPLKTIAEKQPSSRQDNGAGSSIPTPKINTLKDRRNMKKLGGGTTSGAGNDESSVPQSTKIRSSSNNNLLDSSMMTGSNDQGPTKLPSLKDRRNQKKQGGIVGANNADNDGSSGAASGRIRSTSNAHFSSTLGSLSLDQSQLLAPSIKPIVSLKDKRNQRKGEDTGKSGNGGGGGGGGGGTTKNNKKARSPSNDLLQNISSKLDKIQESVHQSGADTGHQSERRKSRARAYSKIHERTFQQHISNKNALNMTADQSRLMDDSALFNDNSKGDETFDDNNNDESLLETPSKKDFPDSSNNQDRGFYQTEQPSSAQRNFNDDFISPQNLAEGNQQDEQDDEISPSKEFQSRWSKEDLMSLNYKVEEDVLIDFECVNGNKLIMIFQDFTVREYSLVGANKGTLINDFNLRDLIGEESEGDRIVAFAIDKELGLVAVANLTQVMLFDFQDNFSPVTNIEVPNVSQIVFCQYFVIVVINEGSETILVSYQLDDELIEMSSYIVENLEGTHQSILLKSDNEYAYLCQGSSICKMSVPELEKVFVVESGHSGSIIDVCFTPSAIFTTATDSAVRGFSTQDGSQVIAPIDDLECEHLESEGDFVLTRCGGGQAFLVWKKQENFSELQLIDEIDLDQLDEADEVIDFKMKGHISLPVGTTQYNYVVMLSVTEQQFIFKALKHRPLFA